MFYSDMWGVGPQVLDYSAKEQKWGSEFKFGEEIKQAEHGPPLGRGSYPLLGNSENGGLRDDSCTIWEVEVQGL